MPKNSKGKELYQIPEGHWARYKDRGNFYTSGPDDKEFWDLGWFLDEKVVEHPRDLLIPGDIVEILFTGNNKYYKLEVEKITPHVIETSHIVIGRNQAMHYDEDLKEIPTIRAIWTRDRRRYTEQWRYKE